MVGVVQLVERQVVILNVAGSSPVTHPKGQRALNRCYRRLARRDSQTARTTADTKTTAPTPTAAMPAAPRAVPIPPKRCPCLRRLAVNDASTVTSDKVNTSNPSHRCTKRTGCDPECRGFEIPPDGVHPLSAPV